MTTAALSAKEIGGKDTGGRGIDRDLKEILISSRDGLAYDSVDACFMLSGDDESEYSLPSTIAREIGFAAHHAIHHMAMVRIIAEINFVDLPLPQGLWKAPSTLNFEKTHGS